MVLPVSNCRNQAELAILSKVVLLAILIFTTALAGAGLSGEWIFEARTSEGSLRAKLALQEDGKKLVATLWIDGHVLRGTGDADGTRLEVLLVHADGAGPGHGDRLRLIGNLDRGEISGSWDNGYDHGSWTARREQSIGAVPQRFC